MSRKILVINGHPDPRPERLCAALASAYARGADAGGHQVRRLDVAALQAPPIRSQADFTSVAVPPDIEAAQAALRWADHVVIVHPLWLGGMPAVFKAFVEQVFRYGFAVSPPGGPPRGLLRGRSARVVVTMGMPSALFRIVFGAAGVKALERGVLWLSGFRPIRRTLIGNVEAVSAATRRRWIAQMKAYGRRGV